jgi:hypothetical protein
MHLKIFKILGLQKYHGQSFVYYHKLHESWFGNNRHAKSTFHMFIWNKHGCHSSICIVWTLMFCTLFKHECHILFVLFKHKCCLFVRVVHTPKSCTQLLCLNNAQHLCLNNMNLWNNKFHTDLEQTYEACKFVMTRLKWQPTHCQVQDV